MPENEQKFSVLALNFAVIMINSIDIIANTVGFFGWIFVWFFNMINIGELI